MKEPTDARPTPHRRRLARLKGLSLTAALLGAALMVFMIVVEDEPGAVPLALLVVGGGGYLLARARLRALPS